LFERTADLVPLGRNTDLVHRRRMCPKPIGDDAARSPVFLHDRFEKLQRRGFVSLRVATASKTSPSWSTARHR